MVKNRKVYLSTYLHLLTEWHPTKNCDLDPSMVTHGSRRRVWWVCRAGHEWESKVYNRVIGTGCPTCAGKKVQRGFNDLATTHPELAAEWSPRNEFGPESVTAGSNKLAWWLCSSQHEWEASPGNRSSKGSGCPYCSGRYPIPGETCLESQRPDLAKEWSTKNDRSPREVTVSSNRQAIWVCTSGHEWTAIVANRSKGHGCPYCTGRRAIPGETCLASQRPDLAREWPTKNDRSPREVTPSSEYMSTWVCTEYGHEWVAVIYNRAAGNGCPVCANKKVLPGFNDLATTHLELVKEWSPKNEFAPETVSAGSGKKVLWICVTCGDEWCARVHSRTKGTGCPKCCLRQTSKIEAELFRLLSEKFPEAGQGVRVGRWSVDVLLPKEMVVVEYDGTYWHQDREQHDTRKTLDLLKLGYRVVRIREQSNQHTLPELGIEDLKYLELVYEYSADWHVLDTTVNKITEWSLSND